MENKKEILFGDCKDKCNKEEDKKCGDKCSTGCSCPKKK